MPSGKKKFARTYGSIWALGKGWRSLETEHYRLTRDFLDHQERYLRHLFEA